MLSSKRPSFYNPLRETNNTTEKPENKKNQPLSNRITEFFQAQRSKFSENKNNNKENFQKETLSSQKKKNSLHTNLKDHRISENNIFVSEKKIFSKNSFNIYKKQTNIVDEPYTSLFEITTNASINENGKRKVKNKEFVDKNLENENTMKHRIENDFNQKFLEAENEDLKKHVQILEEKIKITEETLSMMKMNFENELGTMRKAYSKMEEELICYKRKRMQDQLAIKELKNLNQKTL